MSVDQPLSIYIVDDDDEMIQFMTVVLEAAGHRVQSDVLSTTAISDIARQRPDVLLTDLVMGGVSGIDLCNELNGDPKLKDMKIIFVTSKTEKYWRDQAEAAGAIGYIEKPLEAGTFTHQVETLVAQASGQTEAGS